MIYRPKETTEARTQREAQWHRWYAWHPVRLDDGSEAIVWWEPVERCRRARWSSWYYRPVGSDYVRRL